jgi:hypothetical protein
MTEMYTTEPRDDYSTEPSAPPRREVVQLVGAAQGYVLDGYLYDARDSTYVVLLRRPFSELHEFLTGRVDRLTDIEWRTGVYFGNVRAAARNMCRRAGVDVE